MRNLLITVMMLVVVALMFNGIIANDTTGTRAQIESKGTTANTTIGSMAP